MLVNSIASIAPIVVSVIGLLGVIVSILSFFVKTSEDKKLQISPFGMAAIIISCIILCVGLVLLQYFPMQGVKDGVPDFEWDYECFEGANLCIMTHDGNLYSSKDIFLAIGFSENNASVICESPTPTIWVEIHPLASYEVSAFFDFGEYNRKVASSYAQLPGVSSPDTVQIVHLYLP